MKATTFLNVDDVIVKVSDGTWYIMPPNESKRWVADFLYYVAGKGENVSNIKDGSFENGNFTNNIRAYYDIRPHKKVEM